MTREGRAPAYVMSAEQARVKGEPTYRHLGLTFCSPYRLGHPGADGSAEVDVDVTIGDRNPVPDDPPSAEVMASLVFRGRPFYTVASLDTGYCMRVHRAVDFRVSEAAEAVECRPAPTCEEGRVAGFLISTVSAFLLSLRGFAVLHASAVEIDGRAVAFVGSTGAGKTTCAALSCVAGAGLVTDDVLPLASDGNGPLMVGGRATELRLRPGAASIVDLWPSDVDRRATADGRVAVSPPVSGPERLPLGAVLLPRPNPEATEPALRPVRASEAFFALAAESRLSGLRDPGMHERLFRTISRVIESVPVAVLEMPYSSSFDTASADSVLSRLAGVLR